MKKIYILLLTGLMLGTPIITNAAELQCSVDRTVFPNTQASTIKETSYLLCDKQAIELIEVQESQLKKEETLENAKRQAVADFLQGQMAGQEALFYDRAVELGLDPVFAVALASWETGYGKSTICVNKHNFGGMRGRDGWMAFESTEKGIEAYLNLLVSYQAKGLNTAEKMSQRYAEGSESWIAGVNGIQWKINQKIEQYQSNIN